MRSVVYGENRRLLDLLSENGEILTVSCRVSSKLSPINALTMNFILAEFELFAYRDRLRLDGGHLEYNFSGLQEDLERLAAASHLSEIYLDALRTHEAMPRAYQLWAYSLNRLNNSATPLLDVRVAQLRFLSELGFRPWLYDCAVCHAEYGEGSSFSFPEASLICPKAGCRENLDRRQMQSLSPGLIAVLRYILDAPFNALFSFDLSDRVRKEFKVFSDRYLEWVMEKAYHRLDIVEDLANFTQEIKAADLTAGKGE